MFLMALVMTSCSSDRDLGLFLLTEIFSKSVWFKLRRQEKHSFAILYEHEQIIITVLCQVYSYLARPVLDDNVKMDQPNCFRFLDEYKILDCIQK